jgi:spore germination protein
MRSPVRWSFLFLLSLFALPAHAWRMSAWIPSWDANAVTIMQSNGGRIDEANPGWYSMSAAGAVVKNYNAEDPAMRAALTGTLLLPTIKNYINGSFDGAAVAMLLANATTRDAHADNLTNLVVQNAFDGIDIDYERVPTTSRANLTAFLTTLGQKLHERGKLLSVTVVAKQSDGENWNGPGAQDWVAIGHVADSIKIMAYDYHWDGSAAGPLTPLAWLEGIATYATQSLPLGRAIIGLPWYGYDWLGTTATTVTYAQAMATATKNGATVTRDASGELTYTYAGRTVYFQDAISYKTKIDAISARHSGIAGFAAWRVGAEDPALWDLVGQLKNIGGGSSAHEPAAQDFVISGPESIRLAPGAQQTATFSLLGVNGFDGVTTVSARMLDPLMGSIALSSSRIVPSAATTLTVSAWSPAQPGTYRVEVTMTSGPLTRKQVLDVVVARSGKARAVR